METLCSSQAQSPCAAVFQWFLGFRYSRGTELGPAAATGNRSWHSAALPMMPPRAKGPYNFQVAAEVKARQHLPPPQLLLQQQGSAYGDTHLTSVICHGFETQLLEFSIYSSQHLFYFLPLPPCPPFHPTPLFLSAKFSSGFKVTYHNKNRCSDSFLPGKS